MIRAGRYSSSAARTILAVTALLPYAKATTAEGQPDWIHFTDETTSRLVADPSLGIDDPFEKDIAVGDVDKDGDPDVIVVRKARFSTPGGQPNVLFLNEGGTMVDRTADFIPQFNDATDDRDVVLADVNDDSWLDMITATTFGEQPRIYMNLGNDEQGQWLGFQYNPEDNRLPIFSPAPKFCAVAAGDITGDRIPDLFFVDYDNTLEDRLLINDGNGFFTDETAIRMTVETSFSAFGTAGEIVDINRDGFNDIIKCSTLDDDPRLPGKLLLRTPGGRMGVPRQLVLRIERGETTFDTYDEKRSRIRDNDYQQLYDLARWCREDAGLREETYPLLEKVIALRKGHVKARHLLGYMWTGTEWEKIAPLPISIELTREKDLTEAVRGHFSIVLQTRKDLKIVEDPKIIETTGCRLVLSITTDRSPGAKFYGLQVQGPTAHATIELIPAARWIRGSRIRNSPFEVLMKGEVRQGTPNARLESVSDGFTRSNKAIHDFFDEILEHRIKLLEATVKKEPSEDSPI